MKTITLVFLAAFTAWGASVVSRDMATRKIPNASLRTGLKLLAAALLALGFYTWMGYAGREQSFLNYNFYLFLGKHLFWTMLAGIILWYAEVWPAGDAKFFMVVSAALPLANPYLRNFPDFLFIALLINIFVAAALWAVGSYLASGFYAVSPSDFYAELWSDVKKRLGELAGGRTGPLAAVMVVNMGFLFLLQQIMSLELRGFVGRVFARTDLLFFFLFILWDKIGDVFSSKRWVYISVAGYLLYFGLGYFLFPDRLWLVGSAALKNVFRFSIILFFGRFMLEFMMEKKDARFVGPAELEPGVLLSAKAARTLRENPVFEGLFDDCFKDGLTEEQVEAVRAWMAKLEVREPKIEIVVGRPFALWIFAGAALTLVLDRNIAGLLK